MHNGNTALRKRQRDGGSATGSRSVSPVPGTMSSGGAGFSTVSRMGVPPASGSPGTGLRPTSANIAGTTQRKPPQSCVASVGPRYTHPTSSSARSSGVSRASTASSESHQSRRASGPSAFPPEMLVQHAEYVLCEAKVERETENLGLMQRQLEETMDAAEAMVSSHEHHITQLKKEMFAAEAAHHQAMKALQTREQRNITKKQRALEEVESMKLRVQNIQKEKEVMEALIDLQGGKVLEKEEELRQCKGRTETLREELRLAEEEAHLMEDDSYGLSGEVKDVVVKTKQVEGEIEDILKESMKLEMIRRELFSTAEALKGSIRVYCRVRGRVVGPKHVSNDGQEEDHDDLVGSRSVSDLPDAELESDSSTVADTLEEQPPSPISSLPFDSPLPTVVPSTRTSTARSSCASVSSTSHRQSSVAPHSSTTIVPRIRLENNTNSCHPSKPQPGASTLRMRAGLPAPLGSSSGRRNNLNASSSSDKPRPRSGWPIARPPLSGKSAVRPVGAAAHTAAEGGAKLFSFAPSAKDIALVEELERARLPEDEEQNEASTTGVSLRTITVHQTRHNATSTGTNATTESFTFDQVFDETITQERVYAQVEPLILNAVDGYSICIFAYGQTGSGKTFSMEGNLSDPSQHGITPRSMHTIVTRAKELEKEGWRYEFRCSVIEIYNDTIRDLLQSPSLYDAGGAAFQQPNYHVIQHHPEEQSTTVSHVKEQRIHEYKDFQKVYQQAVRNRRTAATTLNARSSRSHCICVLHLDGTNDVIRQRSRGKLCLVDLAGSERVNDSGVKGQQLKEAININKSLLDLGKCISALRSNAVVPWRNSKLTHFLQLYLGAKGGKMLMLVTVSEKKEHVSETVNALRFAARVSETIVGPSVKRVVKY